ncbi:SCF E3 ubiquitin ligase complex F-box protein grrA-like [Vicia villosa]|uniref:SCF E3 ubiquitin ligase complex F-box protein grrA-like n=1 Tax=Vicia villosa TaxID=3911 RepID=UPI00273C9C3B|nr:SCF E3 ubiquitin ligase complex F-box protein grrA-like [Vicia villosa]
MLKLKRFVFKLKGLLFKTPKPKFSTDLYLDDDCWQYVFKFIFDDDEDDNRRHFKSLSLVSKQFLSITNRLRFSLTVWNPTLPLLPRLFPRFTNLISLDLSWFLGDINDLLVQISRFPLKLTSLNISNQPTIPAHGLRVFSRNITTITSLVCSRISSLHIDDLYLISECFPFLQELDIDNDEKHQSDFGIRNVKVNSTTPMVFPNLRKINISRHNNIDDQCLLHLSKNSELLEELVMLRCPSIQHLNLLRHADVWNDQHVMDLSLLLGRLVSINLSFRTMLTESTLFSLVRKCPSLTQIKMCYTNIGKEDIVNSNSLKDFVVRPQLKSLHLANTHLRDESIKMFASIFPNLERLDLSKCHNISDEGIYQVLRRCSKIRYLNLASCEQVKLHELNFEIPKLKVLNLSFTSIDDETLYAISKSCSGLLQLLLKSCYEVTNNGIMHVVNNCTQLREIDLVNCRKLLPNIVDEVIFSRPSLRKLYISLYHNKRKLYSRDGCLVF